MSESWIVVKQCELDEMFQHCPLDMVNKENLY